MTATRIGFLGPFGTFTQQALQTVPDAAASEPVPYRTVPDVLDAVAAGGCDLLRVQVQSHVLPDRSDQSGQPLNSRIDLRQPLLQRGS